MAWPDIKLSFMGGVLAAVGASVCCVGPLALLALGIGGAWIGNLSALEPIRPVFIVLTAVFMAMAFRRLYLMPRACEAGTPCADPLALRRRRWLFWFTALAVSTLLAVPSMAPLFY